MIPFVLIAILFFAFHNSFIWENKMGRKLDKYKVSEEKKRYECIKEYRINGETERWFNGWNKNYEVKSLEIHKVNFANSTLMMQKEPKSCIILDTVFLFFFAALLLQFHSSTLSLSLRFSSSSWQNPKWKIYIETKLNLSNAVFILLHVVGTIWMAIPFQWGFLLVTFNC